MSAHLTSIAASASASLTGAPSCVSICTNSRLSIVPSSFKSNGGHHEMMRQQYQASLFSLIAPHGCLQYGRHTSQPLKVQSVVRISQCVKTKVTRLSKCQCNVGSFSLTEAYSSRIKPSLRLCPAGLLGSSMLL